MKSLKNETTEIVKDKDNDTKQTYADLLIVCLNNVPNGGFTPELMAARVRVIDIVKKGGDVIELEDADAKTAKEAVNSVRWNGLHSDLVKFTNYCNEVL